MSSSSALGTATTPPSQPAPDAALSHAGPPAPSNRKKHSRGTNVTGWVFVTPNLIILVAFLFLPLVLTWVVSFQSASPLGTTGWAGVENYTRLFTDLVFWRVLLNSVVFTVLTVPLSIAIGLGLALLLNKAIPGRGIFRTAIYLPIVLSNLVTSLMGLLLFNEGVGVLNSLLGEFGIGDVPWQSNGTLAMMSLVLMTVWTRVGFAMVIYLAALQDVPQDLYEAARLDGASSWQQFRFITRPLLSASTLFLVVINVIWSFQIFDIVYIMTGGGPGDATAMLVTYSYDQGFGPSRDFGYGSAIGVVLFLLTLAMTAVRLRSSKKEKS